MGHILDIISLTVVELQLDSLCVSLNEKIEYKINDFNWRFGWWAFWSDYDEIKRYEYTNSNSSAPSGLSVCKYFLQRLAALEIRICITTVPK